MKLTKKIIEKLLNAILMTRPDEIGCDDCFEELQKFVELELAGNQMDEVMPLVKDHLNSCRDCKEEYEALLVALNNL